MEEQRKPFAVQAGIISLWAPIIAICMNFFGREIMVSRDTQTLIGYISIVLYISGLTFGVIGLIGVRKYGAKGILVRSILGVLLNSFIIVYSFIVISKLTKAKMTVRDRMAQTSQTIFTLKAPEQFVKIPKSEINSPKILEAYVKGDLTDDSPDIFFYVEDLGGILVKEDLSKYIIGKENIKIQNEFWKNHQLQVIEIREIQNDYEMLTYNIQIPLLPKAILLRVFGPAEREDEIQALFKEILTSIDGPTNWK